MGIFRQKKKDLIISVEERQEFSDLLDRDKAAKDVIKITQAVWTKNRKLLNDELVGFWKQLFEKYKLEKTKDYSLDKHTGEITVVKTPVKISKEGESNG